MRRLPALLVLPLVTLPLLAACAPPVAPSESQVREIEDVTAVVLVTSGDLVISLGEPSLTITAPADVIDSLTSESADDLLVLGSQGPGQFAGEIRYELTLPAVTTVRNSGSGDVDVDFSAADDVHVSVDGSGDLEGTGIDAATASVSISGSGDVELAGRVDGVSARIEGSGDMELADLVSQDAFADVRGSGNLRVHATRMLRVDLSGSGSVHYSGGAEVTSDITGSGSLVED